MKLVGVAAMTLLLLAVPTLADSTSTELPAPSPAAVSPGSGLPSGHALTPNDLEAWLDGYLPDQLKRADIAGAVVVVVKDGHVLFEKGYGTADVATRRPVDPETTLFRVGSVSKLITWTAVMQQVELGRIDLDRDVNAYLDFKIPPFDGKPVTMRNLMTHTAGFQDSLKDMLNGEDHAPELGNFLKRQVPDRIYPPGEVPAYSNYGAALAGYIVERVSGEPIADYVDAHVFAPLGMRHSTFRQPLPPALKPLMSKGYIAASDGPMPFEMFGPVPAGGATVSGADMARFMIAHLENGAYEGHRILKAETARQMHDSAYTTMNPALDRMLLGFYEDKRNGHRVIGHDGDTRFFHSMLRLYLDDGAGLFIAINSVGSNMNTFAIRQDLFDGFTDRYFPGPTPSGSVPLAIAKAHAAMMAGQYYGGRREDTTFASFVNLISQTSIRADENGHLVTSLTGVNGQPQKFEEVAPFLWREIGGKELLGAKVANGRVVMWGAGDDAATDDFTRVPASRDAVWLLPLLLFSVAALLIAALAWPIGAVVRRRYGARFPLEGAAARAYRWSRIGAAASGLVMVAWLVMFGAILSTFYIVWAPYFISSSMVPWILTLHLLSIVAFPLAAIAALWNLWVTCTTRTGWRNAPAWLWSGVLLLGCATILWVGVAFHLIGLSVAF